MSQTKSSSSSVFSAFGTLMFGAVCGAIIGVLYAPKSGVDTREELTDWVKNQRENGYLNKQKIKGLFSKAKHTIDQKKEELVP